MSRIEFAPDGACNYISELATDQSVRRIGVAVVTSRDNLSFSFLSRFPRHLIDFIPIGNVNRYLLRAMHWYESFICVNKLSEFPCSNRIAPPCTQVRYGAITALNRCENYVLHTTMFLEKLPFCLETAVPVSCLPRVICQHAKC